MGGELTGWIILITSYEDPLSILQRMTTSALLMNIKYQDTRVVQQSSIEYYIVEIWISLNFEEVHLLTRQSGKVERVKPKLNENETSHDRSPK